MEEEHLLTKASVPYRDQDLNSSKDDIINRRLNEQFSSNYGIQKSKKYLNHFIEKITLRINFLNAVFYGVMLEKKSTLFLPLLISI